MAGVTRGFFLSEIILYLSWSVRLLFLHVTIPHKLRYSKCQLFETQLYTSSTLLYLEVLPNSLWNKHSKLKRRQRWEKQRAREVKITSIGRWV